MKILFISLEHRNPGCADNDSGVMSRGCNALAMRRSRRLLPIQMLAIAADLIEAGHNVHWPEESLSHANMDRVVADARVFAPDMVFFACCDLRSQHLMATVAVKTGGVSGNEFLNDATLRPARYWCDQLVNNDYSAQHLLKAVASLVRANGTQ